MDVARRGNAFEFAGTDTLGVYEVSAGGRVIDRFAVNLFDSDESDIRPRLDPIKIGHVEVAGQPAQETVRREGSKYLVLAALAVLLSGVVYLQPPRLIFSNRQQ